MKTMHLSFMALFVVMLLAFSLYYTESIRFYSSTGEYSGFIYLDEECSYMQVCGEEGVMGFVNKSGLDIYEKYRSFRGTGWCAPVAGKFRGIITSPGEHDYYGPDGPPFPKDMEIYEFYSFVRASEGYCDDKKPFPKIVTVYDDELGYKKPNKSMYVPNESNAH